MFTQAVRRSSFRPPLPPYADPRELASPPRTADHIWQRLLRHGHTRRLGRDQDLWLEGEENLYVVLEGMMRLYRLTSEGKAVTLVAVTAGGILGRHPYLTQPRRGLIAGALTETALLTFSPEQLGALLHRAACRAPLHDWFLADLDRLHTCMYLRLQAHEVGAREKLARVLLALDAAGLGSVLKRRQIAELANLTVETTVRLIASMSEEGVLKNRDVNTLDQEERHALTEVAGEGVSRLPYL